MKADLTVEIEHSLEGWGATVEVECLYEYGWGGTEEEAIDDLVSSLGDYKLWLIERKGNLADCSARDLELIEGHGCLGVDYRALTRALYRKALADENRSGDHIVFSLRMDGREQRITKISHGARGQMPKRLLGKIARQMRLSSRQLQQFVDCTLSRHDWLHLWDNALPRG